MKRRARLTLTSQRVRRGFVFTALIVLGWPWIEEAYRFAEARYWPQVFVAAAGLLFARRIYLSIRLWRRLRALAFSDRARSYVIERADYRRGTAKESIYRRTMQLTLLATFDNRCAKCGANDDGVDLDHFFLPKAEGGNFIMRHADGYLVNNAVPLCVRCNRSKSDRNYRAFFATEELPALLTKNAEMTRLLNQRQPLDDEGQPQPRRRPRAA